MDIFFKYLHGSLSAKRMSMSWLIMCIIWLLMCISWLSHVWQLTCHVFFTLQGSYYCGFCKDGYVGSSLTGCVLADFCLSGVHKCDTNANCIYTGPEEYKCEVGNSEIKQLWPLFSLCFEILTWYLVCGCIMISYRSSLRFVPVQWFLAELWPLDFEIWSNI